MNKKLKIDYTSKENLKSVIQNYLYETNPILHSSLNLNYEGELPTTLKG